VKKLKFDISFFSKRTTEIRIGDDLDYLKIFYAALKQYEHVYLFESLELPRHQDRYFTMGFNPYVTFVGKGDQLIVKGNGDHVRRILALETLADVASSGIVFEEGEQASYSISGVNPYEVLRTLEPLDFQGQTHQGGLVGYFSYEAVNYFEPAVRFNEHKDFDTFHLGLYVDGLIYDNLTGTLSYYTFGDDRSDHVRNLVTASHEIVVPNSLEGVTDLGPNCTEAEHRSAIENTLEDVRAGNTFQCEVGFKNNYILKGDKVALYEKLRKINPSPYMFFLQCGAQILFGASPEILVACTNGRILTTPTAGTIVRGSTEAEDRRLARTLLCDEKEIAEHNMLVDLHRNDLARCSTVGSVQVSDLMYLIKFSHVQHIVSDVIGELDGRYSTFDLLAAILPGGVVSGAPKIETMKIIDRNEGVPRGPYGGAVGRFSLNGDCAFCLPIRSIFCNGDECFVQTSSGVVYDSVPENEYQEIRHKLGAMARAIAAAAGR
jgi:anthranilate synthase component 1